MIVLKKNKKEGFTDPYVYTASDFKTKVETALGDNLTAIQNLGNFAGQLISDENELDLSAVELKLKKLLIKDESQNVDVLDKIKLMQSAISVKENIADVDKKLENYYTKTYIDTIAGAVNRNAMNVIALNDAITR